ncbi:MULTISPECIES: acetyl-CoA carboxylase biotin carboxyl carrier protein [Clostridium]|uniref:acetyl-CoA carboxylase biotin carboxyl carrier protein n=1 Tax=Clostridium TaxID=1485 RepID=UPI000826739B|nr:MULTISPECIES: acetyl-CoA carboxylase biotin carboxyl carrier protein [Clostridium]PJI08513.1 acetyl-CoA carboxylase biotin carboxyl carrier protein [Clostridium sp. CT7]
MDYASIEKLVKTIDNSGLTYFQVESNGTKITIKKGSNNDEGENTIANSNAAQSGLTTAAAQDNVQNNVESIATKEEVKQDDPNVKVVTSPIVGTFYQSSAADAEPFVKVGSKVKKGQTLCIIEAMKLMNEIQSEYDGEIVEVLAQNEEMVEYGKELFKIAVK